MLEDFLEIRTLSLITSIVAISIFLGMLYVTIRRKAYPGFLEWTIGTLFNSFGMVLLAMRHLLPDFISIIIANNFILLYFIFSARGISRFSDSTQNLWMDVVPVFLLTISFWIFTYITPSVNFRIIIITGLIFLICCRICYLIWRKMPNILPNKQNFLFITFGFVGIWHLSRLILTVFFEGEISDFMEAGFIQGLAFVNIIVTTIINSMLLIICNAHRLEIDLLKARDKINTLSGLLPICSSCKKIRNDEGDWEHLEKYICGHSEALFTHGICDTCMKKLYPEFKQDDS
jgi:hypothetical protein